MKCIILLSFVALCYSYQYGTGYGTNYGYGYGSGYGSGYSSYPYGSYGSGRYVDVNQDGSITVTAANGRRFSIARGYGPNSVAVSEYERYSGYQPSQDDAIAQILSQYQGYVNQDVYQQLLREVGDAVQSGQVSRSIYDALQNVYQPQRQVGQSQYYGRQVGYNRSPIQTQTGLQQQLAEQQVPYFLRLGGYGQQRIGSNYYTAEPERTSFRDLIGYYFGGYKQQQYPGPYYQYPTYSQYQYPGLYSQYRQYYPYSQSQYRQYYPYGQSEYRQYYPYGQSLYRQYYPYGQQVGQYATGQLSQLIQGESEILGKQNQVQQQQLQLQQQQQELTQEQLQQQQQQQQQQNQQQYLQEVQQEVQREQEQVLETQQQVQQQELQQQPQYSTLRNLLNGVRSYAQTRGQQYDLLQQRPSVYSQGGLYGVYGQRYNIPLVY